MIQSYPWYIADWRNSETRLSLTLAQRGLYREFLDYCYLEGSMPANREQLESIAGATGKQTRYNLEAVLNLFVLKDGRYHHAKVDEVLPRLIAYHEQKKHAGAKSGNARRERMLNARSTGVGTKAEPIPTTTPSTETIKTPPSLSVHSEVHSEVHSDSELAQIIGECAERMYSLHPKKKNLVLVPGALQASVNGAKELQPFLIEVETCHAAWCKTEDWIKGGGRFAPPLDQWIADRGYTQWPEVHTPSPSGVRLAPPGIKLVPHDPFNPRHFQNEDSADVR